MDEFMSTLGASAPTALELELLRDLALRSEDVGLRVAVSVALAGLPPGVPGEPLRRANARCLQEIERWRAQPVMQIETPQLIDLAASATRGSDYHALHVIRVAMDCPARGATPEQERAFSTCLTAWNSRAARLAGVA